MDRKLTVTIPSALIDKIDAEVSEHGYESASDVVALALIHWLEPVSENWPPSDADLRRLVDESLVDSTEYTPEEVRQHFDERLAESMVGTTNEEACALGGAPSPAAISTTSSTTSLDEAVR